MAKNLLLGQSKSSRCSQKVKSPTPDDNDEENSWFTNAFALVSPRVALFSIAPPCMGRERLFFNAFYPHRALSSHVGVTRGKRHGAFFAFPIRREQKAQVVKRGLVVICVLKHDFNGWF